MEHRKKFATSLKEARIRQNKSLLKLSKELGISKEIIRNVEEWKANELPEEPFLSKILERYASVISIAKDEKSFREQSISPKKRFNSKTIIISDYAKKIALGGFFLLIAGYLTFTGFGLISNPKLIVTQPDQIEETSDSEIMVEGVASQQNTVNINGKPVLVSENGYFSQTVFVREGQNFIEISSANSIGRQTSRVLEVYRR